MSCLNHHRANRLASSLRNKRFDHHGKNNSSLPVSLFISQHNKKKSTLNLVSWYRNKLDSHPLLTKSLTASLIAGTGDVTCQYMTSSSSSPQSVLLFQDEWNWKRTGRFMLVGCLYSAPARHYYFNYLARSFAGSSPYRVAQRVFMERVVFAPISLAVWLTTMWTLESVTGETTVTTTTSHSPWYNWQGYCDTFSATYPTLLWTSWSWWTPIMALNFRYVPVQYQVLYVNAFNLVWNTYLSYMTSNSSNRELDKTTSGECRVVEEEDPIKWRTIEDSFEHVVEMHMVTNVLY